MGELTILAHPLRSLHQEIHFDAPPYMSSNLALESNGTQNLCPVPWICVCCYGVAANQVSVCMHKKTLFLFPCGPAGGSKSVNVFTVVFYMRVECFFFIIPEELCSGATLKSKKIH